jgi:hypothetical protein
MLPAVNRNGSCTFNILLETLTKSPDKGRRQCDKEKVERRKKKRKFLKKKNGFKKTQREIFYFFVFFVKKTYLVS